MRKRMLSILLCFAMVLGFLPTAAFATEPDTTPEPTATGIYVRNDGNDETGDGSQEKPYATLSKAVEDVSETEPTTIYVLSNLTVSELAYFTKGDITITSGEGGPFSIRRSSESFETNNDARSWYNPAMIEVSGNSANPTKLTLENIVLSDEGNKSGSHFIDARPNNGGQTNGVSHTEVVQDAMIASYNGTGIITLGTGAVLKDFGGMSAVRVTKDNDEQLGGMLIMKADSTICDEKVSDRTKESDDYGPAGAVWLNGGEFIMEAGSEICNMVGRAVYADGGSAEIGGTISGIKGDADMWQRAEGSVLHLRNDAVVEFYGTAENCSGAPMVKVDKATFDMKQGSFIGNSNVGGIKVNEDLPGDYTGKPEDYNTIIIDGEISGITGNNNPIQFKYGVLTIGSAAKIHDNSVSYGAVYLQRDAIAHIYGKIYNNTASGRGGGIGTSGHGFVEINVHPGAEIKNNTAKNTGGGASLKNCKFTMYGGEISGNTGKTGGGIYLYSDSVVDILGGTITNNTANIGSNDLAVTSTNYGTDSIYLYISDKALIGNPAVYMEQNAKTVSPSDRNIKLHNASTDSNTALKNASTNDKGWADPLATFWVQRDGAASLTVGGLNLDKNLPVYVLTQKTGANGTPDSAAVNTYAAAVDADGNVSFTLPIADVNGNGCAVAIVQPTQDFGALTISGPETIKQNKTGEDYPVTYTVTYDMSESLSSIIAQAGGNAEYSLAITADARLTGIPGSFDGNSIQVTYTLPNGEFAAGDSLFASAELTVTVGQGRYVIPSNVTETKLLGLESFHVVFDWNDGSGKTETVSVTEGESLGDAMIADPTRSGYTFTGWNNQQDGKGSSFDNSTVITGSLTVYAQWSENSSGGSGSSTYYYFAIEKVDAQDDSALSGAKFGLFLDGKQIATATSNRSGIATFRVDESDYRKITTKSDLYYQELTAPEGYVVSSDKIDIEKSDLTTSQTSAEKNAETVRNYRGSTPDLLNGDDHFAYVVGYQDGCVHPNALITRAETATIFFRLLKDDVRDGNLRTSNTFADVPNDYWANTAISTMAGLGIVQGRSSTAFDPNASITRAEFAAICARFDTGTSSGTQTFSDISGHWAEKYIQRAAELGWIKGFEDGTFRPDDCITRAQAMTMINRVLNRIPEDTSDLLPDMNVWPDCNPGDWFYLAVQEATNSHNYKHKAGNYETWISMKQDPDWTRYEN